MLAALLAPVASVTREELAALMAQGEDARALFLASRLAPGAGSRRAPVSESLRRSAELGCAPAQAELSSALRSAEV